MEIDNSGEQTTGQRAYAPAAVARENVFEIAANGGPLNLYGATAPDALAAPGQISFGDFIRLPRVRETYGDPENSDSTRLLLELQEEFDGHATRAMLTAFVRLRHSGKPRGFRYWNHLAASIWNMYQGLRAAKVRTGKAHNSEVGRLERAVRRAGKETARSALRRKPKNLAEAEEIRAAKVQNRIRGFRSRASKKRAQIQILSMAAESLEAKAGQLARGLMN
jgi:hypothetical protein